MYVFFSENLPDALENGCEKCNEKQKELSKKALKHILEHKREQFDALEAKYDPDKKYRKRYEADLKKEGIEL